MDASLNPTTAVDLVVAAFAFLCFTLLIVDVLCPFIDDLADRLFGKVRGAYITSSYLPSDEDLLDETDPVVIAIYSKSEKTPADLQYLERKGRREEAEEYMLRERLR